jgi:hypothetical protein
MFCSEVLVVFECIPVELNTILSTQSMHLAVPFKQSSTIHGRSTEKVLSSIPQDLVTLHTARLSDYDNKIKNRHLKGTIVHLLKGAEISFAVHRSERSKFAPHIFTHDLLRDFLR